MNCQSCGTALSSGAKFCHKCGAAVAAAPLSAASAGGTPWQAIVPWAIASFAVGALVIALVMRGGAGRSGDQGATGAGSPPFANGATGGGGPGSSTLDISRMSPEEMSQRLFNRVMRLQEEGKLDSVKFFAPMAVNTFLQLPALDIDARFDLGLLQLAAGDAQAALAQADTIKREAPTHLWGFILRARADDAKGDAAGAKAACRDFLKNESAERAKQRSEYTDRTRMLDGFHAEAVQRTGTGK